MNVCKYSFNFLVVFSSYLISISTIALGQQINHFESIDIDNLKNHINFLGSDELQGRGTGTNGASRAAYYIASQLNRFDLIPIGDQGSYFQFIPMHGSIPLEQSELLLKIENEDHILNLGQDYVLYKTGAQTFIPNPLPMVFVGYGIIAPEFDYNNYQSVDVGDKIVVFLAGEPYSDDQNYFDGHRPSIYSYPEAKQRIAISRGARGSIMIPEYREEQDKEWSKWMREFAFEDVTLAYSVSSNLSVLINPKVVDLLFKGCNKTLQDIYRSAKQGTISSFELKTELSFSGKFSEREFLSRNVIALFEGSNRKLADTYVLISAHYDHLGIGPSVEGDSIYNGVLDNALGVAVLLELARIFSKQSITTKRSIIFLFLTGEEKGLLGSTYYTDHPIVPLYKTIVNINLDGIAAFDQFNDVIAVGSELSSLEQELKIILNARELEISQIPREFFLESETIYRSDQYSFGMAGIPFVLLIEGLNYKNTPFERGLQRMINWIKNIYHSPFDDLNQAINLKAAQQHCEVILDLATYLANSSQAPEWKPGTPFINARLQTIAEKR